jgi:outer membrane biosynthesis protein TonB
MRLDEAIRKNLLLVAAFPEYPYNARSRLKSGTGLFELKFDYETGHLREVHVVQSTGYRWLDGPCIGALKVWQAKPRSIHTLLEPITFKLRER